MKKWIFTVCGILFAVPAMADLYRMPAISVSAEAENAVVAKQTAWADAAVQAFPKLLDKIVLTDDAVIKQQLVSLVTPEQVAGFVEGVLVANEKNTSTRYMADVTVQFKKLAVQEWLKQQNIVFLENEPEPLVIVPIFRENGQVFVFENEAILFNILKNKIPDNGLHSFVVPEGNDIDRSFISDAVLDGSDYSDLETLIDKYRCGGALVLDITKSGKTYAVKTFVYPSKASMGGEVAFAVSSGATNVPAVVEKITHRAIGQLADQFKTAQTQRMMTKAYITAEFAVSNLSEWTAIEKRLKGINVVDDINTRAIFRDKIYAVVTYSVPLGEVLDKMASAGFYLMPQGDIYVWRKRNLGY